MRWLSDRSVAIIIVLAFVHLFFFAGPQATMKLSRRLAIKRESEGGEP